MSSLSTSSFSENDSDVAESSASKQYGMSPNSSATSERGSKRTMIAYKRTYGSVGQIHSDPEEDDCPEKRPNVCQTMENSTKYIIAPDTMMYKNRHDLTQSDSDSEEEDEDEDHEEQHQSDDDHSSEIQHARMEFAPTYFQDGYNTKMGHKENQHLGQSSPEPDDLIGEENNTQKKQRPDWNYSVAYNVSNSTEFKDSHHSGQSDAEAEEDEINYDEQHQSDEDHTTESKISNPEFASRYSQNAYKMMANMGYKENQGLGKLGQGRLEPVEAAKQEGRRGLGLRLDQLHNAANQWQESLEEIRIPERMDWIANQANDLGMLTMDLLHDWVVRGKEKLTIDDESQFCDPDILSRVLSSKTAFDKLDNNLLRGARTRSNPFELIRGLMFQNRAAMKMANIDSLCDFMFTQPKDEEGRSLLRDDELLYFADICAGPGGFTEYVLFRKQWEAKGFGFTLKGENDFKLDNFFASSPETFDPHYGAEGDGDIFNPRNQESFIAYVLAEVKEGVHFVMADGGFSVKGKENIQEILSKQLYLCQCIVALSILRVKGHFVCKLFDLFTPFSVSLVYLMYKCFDEISICKPNTSRPANSERYLICKGKKPNTETIRQHLFHINEEIFKNSSQPENKKYDIKELVPNHVLFKDKLFVDYIIESNNRFGHNQIVGLIKIAAFNENPDLRETRQNDCRRKCIELWKVPWSIRQAPELKPIETVLTELIENWDKKFLSTKAVQLNSIAVWKQDIVNFRDWYFVPLARTETNDTDSTTFYMRRGRGNVFKYVSDGRWDEVPRELGLEMSPNTLILGEIVQEQIGEGSKGRMVWALHIIDGINLGGKFIGRMRLEDRLKQCDKFARSLNKPNKMVTNSEGGVPQIAIRCKQLIPVAEFSTFFNQMQLHKMKNSGVERPGLVVESYNYPNERFYVVGGMLFLNVLTHEFISAISNTSKHVYYYELETKTSHYITQMKKNPFSSFHNCFIRRHIWKWTHVHQVTENVPKRDRSDELLYRVEIEEYLKNSVKS